jgi:type II secretory pathway pseudopilin PulG
MSKNTRYNGYLLTELLVAMTVLAVILVCIALSLNAFGRINNYQLTRQQCISAAQSELDCIAATGRPIDEQDLKRLWPKMSVEIKQSDGINQWQGLKLVKVKATAKADNKNVSIELARYFASEREIRQ